MSAVEVTDKFVEAWNSGVYDLVVCNLANGDMVGHTGILQAAVNACEVVDACVGRMAAAVEARKGDAMVVPDAQPLASDYSHRAYCPGCGLPLDRHGECRECGVMDVY